MIIIILLVGILILAIIFVNNENDTPTYTGYKSDSKTVCINGVPVNKTQLEIDTIRKQKESEEFKNAVECLRNIIQSDLYSTDDEIRKEVLKGILSKPVYTEKQLADVDFLYNDGKLRSNEEVNFHYEWKQFAPQRENYDKECHKRNVICWIVPFIVAFTITMCCFGWYFLGIPFALLAGLFASLIGGSIGSCINVKNGRKYCMSESDPRLKREKLNQKVAIASTIAAGYSIGKNTKQAAKDIVNVDSWKEMK